MQTVHTFTNLGLRTLPIGRAGFKLVRGADGKKEIVKASQTLSFKDAMPKGWTTIYGDKRTKHVDTPLGGLICGKLKNKQEGELEVFALDCDNQAAWDLFRAVDPSYGFFFESIGKPGGTILYLMPDELRDVNQFSLKNDMLNIEYMAKRAAGANAMVYLPTTANKTKDSIPKGGELTLPPHAVITLIASLKPRDLLPALIPTNLATVVLPFNAPLVKQYVLESKAVEGKSRLFGKLKRSPVSEKIYTIFTPKKFRSLEAYELGKFLHPNNSAICEAGSFSEYIVGVSAIAGADPSIDSALYVDFMQTINAQLDEPYSGERYLSEVIHPMVQGNSKINGKPIWRYNENWDKDSHSISNQYGETIEYFANELVANEFIEYNHTTKTVVYVKGVSPMLDRIYTLDADPQQEKPNRNLVKKLKLVQEENSVRLAPGVFMNLAGRTIINTVEACKALQILRQPSLFPQEVTISNLYVQAFEAFLAHLLDSDKQAMDFMRQLLAFHGRHLTNIPVIIYMVGIGGAGKSQFANMLEALFGTNATRRPISQHVSSRFNDFLENCALLILTETADASRKDQEGIKAVLKTVTGEKSIDLESKGMRTRPNVPVFALPLLLANSLWYEEDTADRRLFPIQPSVSLPKSKPILDFEEVHGLKIVEFILKGIAEGYIPKYLSGFCPSTLPEVPMTAVKRDFSSAQRDPIARVKALIQNGEHAKLFELFEDYNIHNFFTLMERGVTKQAYFKQHLVELVIAIKEGELYPSDRDINLAFTPNNWLEVKDVLKQNTNGTGNASYKKLGRYKWEVYGLKEVYEKWKLEGSPEDTDE